MIPKIIHCCWFGGKSMPNNVIELLNGWKTINPDYEVIVWNEDNFDYSLNQYAREAYENKKWAFVSDYARLKVLFDYGGIYMDTDVEVVKSLDSLLTNKAFSGFEDDKNIPTGTMGSEKGNKWIRLLLDYYENKSFIKPSGDLDLTTNVKIITEITFRNYHMNLNNSFQDLGDVTFYPSDVLCAKSKSDGTICKTDNTITIHHFYGSWTTPKIKLIKFINKYFGNKFVRIIVKIKRKLKEVFN